MENILNITLPGQYFLYYICMLFGKTDEYKTETHFAVCKLWV